MYSGITSGRVLDGELSYTKILEVNMFTFAYRLFHRDFLSYLLLGIPKLQKSGQERLRLPIQKPYQINLKYS